MLNHCRKNVSTYFDETPNDEQWIQADTPGQAVLIFANKAPNTLSRTNYTISDAVLESDYELTYPALTYEAAIPRRFELWWPNGPSQSAKPDSIPDFSQTAAYYSGAGCLTPPVYSNGDQPRQLHFYQLVWKKLTGTYGK